MQAECVYACTLACSRYAAYAYAHGVTGIGQALLYNLLGYGLMFGLKTLYQCDGLAENGHVAFYYTIHIILNRQSGTIDLASLQIWVD